MSLLTGILTGGSNSHETTSEEANALATDFVGEGVVGTLTNTSGVAPATGGFAVNAQATPDMTVAVSAGVAYVQATPSSQGSQSLRVKNTASANVTISANSSGSTKYDWLYLQVDATNAADPNTAGDDVATLTTSRSSSASADDGTPPTYGIHIATITVSNGASSITNANIADFRVQANLGSAPIQIADAFFDFIEDGCVWTGDSLGSTRAASMTTGHVWLAGKRLIVNAVSARTFTASKDTYVDFSDNGDGTAAIIYTEVANNAASPALASGSLRNAIIITGASTIAAAGSINQGQQDRVLPIASSIPYAVTDSLGNLICPRDPSRKLLGYRQIITDSSVITSATVADLAGMAFSIDVPANRKVRLVFSLGNNTNSSSGILGIRVQESTTVLQYGQFFSGGTSVEYAKANASVLLSPTAGVHTYKITVNNVLATGNIVVDSIATSPSAFWAELI